MTAHRRAWIPRAGVVVALAASAFFALPTTPALADVSVGNVSASPNSVDVNGTVRVRFTIGSDGDTVDFNVSSNNSKLSCVDGCSGTRVDAGSFTATLRRSSATLNNNETATITIQARENGLLGRSDEASTQVTLAAREAPPPPPEVQTVAEVSGRVTDENTGDAVPDASVRLTDGQGRTHTTSTSRNGNYKFSGSRDRPIAPGRLQIRATKDGITDTKEVNAAAGARINGQGIALALAGAPTATPDPSAEATEEAGVEEEPTEEAGAEESEGAGGQEQAANEDSGGGGLGSWLLILAGGLLVALGVGAIVLLLMRRKEDDDGDEDGPGGPGPRSGPPAGRGGYRDDDATRITNRAGADPTMVNRGGNLADAPTMMHSAPLVDEEFPDPYGAPLPGPQTPGYGGGQQGWGDNVNGYGDRPGSGAGAYGNAPGSGAGYGAPASGAGYGNAPGSGAGYGAPVSGGGYSANGAGGYDDGYDEPTGRYTGGRGGVDEYGPAADPYETDAYRPSSGAGHGGGYEPTQQYGRDDDGYGAGGYGAGQGGYGDEPRTGAGYDRVDDGYDQQGYDNRAGYDQQGYDDRGGYDQPTTGGGYDQPRGGYGDPNGYDDRAGYDQQGGGYYDDAPRAGHSRSGAPQQSSRSERRSLDWLDD